jgi:hypothetical protein
MALESQYELASEAVKDNGQAMCFAASLVELAIRLSTAWGHMF